MSKNSGPLADLPALLASVHVALAGVGNEATAESVGPEKPTLTQIRSSIAPDALISFKEGKSYKMLRRHLTLRSLTPEAYRTKYGLPSDYLMTTADYSAQRSALAHALGLGQKRRKTASTAVEETEAAPKARGRKAVAETA